MSSRAFLIAGDRLLIISNPAGAALNYHARAFTVAPGQQIAVRHNPRADTVVAITAGQLELMVNGTVAPLGADAFARIAARMHFAWRNPGTEPARILVRTCRTLPNAHRCAVTVVAAA